MVIVELRSYTNDIYSSFLMIRAHDINVSNISTCIPKMNPLLLIHLKKKEMSKEKHGTSYVLMKAKSHHIKLMPLDVTGQVPIVKP